jgi:hypothetical protein
MKETDFLSAFSRAKQAFKPATRSDGSDVDLSEECHDLVEYLRSDLPLTEGHRLFLAAFFSGEALRARGGQSKSTGDPVKQAVARLANAVELCLNLGDAHHQAARFSASSVASTPSLNLVPSITLAQFALAMHSPMI